MQLVRLPATPRWWPIKSLTLWIFWGHPYLPIPHVARQQQRRISLSRRCAPETAMLLLLADAN